MRQPDSQAGSKAFFIAGIYTYQAMGPASGLLPHSPTSLRQTCEAALPNREVSHGDWWLGVRIRAVGPTRDSLLVLRTSDHTDATWVASSQSGC